MESLLGFSVIFVGEIISNKSRINNRRVHFERFLGKLEKANKLIRSTYFLGYLP